MKADRGANTAAVVLVLVALAPVMALPLGLAWRVLRYVGGW